MPETAAVESRLYFCLMCQAVATMPMIRAGGHGGHLLTEFQCTVNQSPDDNTLMRKFREKVEAARRYIGVWRSQGV